MNFPVMATRDARDMFVIALALRLAIPVNGMLHEVPMMVKDDRGVAVPMVRTLVTLAGMN